MLAHPRHLPKPQQQQLAALVAGIQKAIQPVAILCFGCRYATLHRWSCFTDPQSQTIPQAAVFDLLIVTAGENQRLFYETVDMVQQQAATVGCSVNILVHPLHAIQELLQEARYFFHQVCRQGIWLYTKQDLALPALQQAMPSPLADSHTIWEKEIGRAKQFWAQAKNALSSEFLELGAFLLHQVVQHVCMALLKAFMGYRSNSHNITRLLDLTANFTSKVSVVFPVHTKEEKNLLSLLHDAYSDARYNDAYTVSKEQAVILSARAKKLLKLAEQLCHQKQAALQKVVLMNGIFCPTPDSFNQDPEANDG